MNTACCPERGESGGRGAAVFLRQKTKARPRGFGNVQKQEPLGGAPGNQKADRVLVRIFLVNCGRHLKSR